MNLKGCAFSKCDLNNAKFVDTVVTGVRFGYQCRGLMIGQIQTTWNYRHSRMDGIELPKEIAEALKRSADENLP